MFMLFFYHLYMNAYIEYMCKIVHKRPLIPASQSLITLLPLAKSLLA